MGRVATPFVMLLLSVVGWKVFCHQVVPSCDIEAEFCDFNFKIEENYTMMAWGGFLDDVPEIMFPVVVTANGTLKRKRKDCSGLDTIPESDKMNVITADGRYKKIYVVNDKLPATPIVVYEGQEVSVKVKNRLEAGVATMHWHGLRQRGSPWMDGVFGVSQCPIQPRQSFTYRFMADKAGTYWYHSHLGTQRSMGLAGPLIVLPKSRRSELLQRGKDPLPKFDGDFYMVIQDWFEQASGQMYHRLQYELISYRGIEDEECFLATKTADGIDLGIVPFESALINGRGRQYKNESEPDSMVPIETFVVRRGGKYRFRLISAAMAYPFRVSIDRHLLHVISTDGNDVETTPLESIMIQSGERYDFFIEARDPTLEGNYWIRVETLEYFHHIQVMTKKSQTFTAPSRSEHIMHNITTDKNQKVKPGFTLGILRYDDAPLEEPKTHAKLCTGVDPCTHLNCPFENFLGEENRCISISDLRDTKMQPTLRPSSPETFTEFFLNFHFSGRVSEKIGAFKPNINGRIHVPHDKPPQMYPTTHKGLPCDETECNEDACYCTHQLDLPLGNVIQMVLFTNLPPLEFIGITGTAHPVHMHGHSFQVVKIGYPIYNETTGLFERNNPDILCNGTMCNQARWADPSWEEGNIPGVVSHGAPLKDSVIIPAGGYVVIRFLADNPGFWFMHCHVEYHNEMGMALVMKEGDINDMNAAPPNMQDCGDFTWTAEEFQQKVDTPSPPAEKKTAATEGVGCEEYLTRVKFTTFILASTTIMFAVASFSIYCKNAEPTSVPQPGLRRILQSTKREEITQLSESNDEAATRVKRARRKRRAQSRGSASRGSLGASEDDEQREPLIAAAST